MSIPLIECDQLSKTYTVERGGQRRVVTALDGVSLSITSGQTFGLVGESGSGKSTLGQIVAGIVPPSSGEVRLGGVPLHASDPRKRRELRRRLQIVWQDPLASMNAYDTIETIVTEAPIAHGLFDRRQKRARAEAIVDSVGLPTEVIRKRPGQLSGGQLQRIAIGRALALEPELLVCDEVTSALDVSVQAQILNLLYDVQRRTQVAYLFISHDLHVVKHISDSIAVMFAGRFVETGSAQSTYANPQHPYSRQLVGAVDPSLAIGDTAADLDDVLARKGVGCRYVVACPLRRPICLERDPALALAPSGALAACHVVAPADPEIAARTGAGRNFVAP